MTESLITSATITAWFVKDPVQNGWQLLNQGNNLCANGRGGGNLPRRLVNAEVQARQSASKIVLDALAPHMAKWKKELGQ